MLPWPDVAGKPRRASINSFGYGGANAHAVLEEARQEHRTHHVSSYISADEDFSWDVEEIDEDVARPQVVVLSANDAASLKSNIEALCGHLVNPRVKVRTSDLAYTLSQRRSRLWHRAFVTTRNNEIEVNDFTVGKKNAQAPKIGFVFTGQGAQWPQMGKELLQFFPWTRDILKELDQVLQTVPSPPKWSLVEELTQSRSADHVRQPEFSQPLVTAIQLCIMAVLESWGIKPSSVVGHSSGEIAAAYAAGLLNRASAIKAAFYRGRAAVNRKDEAEPDVGMLAVGLGSEAMAPFLEKYDSQAWIACFNSQNSLTVSGKKISLEKLAKDVKAEGHFARLLQVDLAYHSELMNVIGEEYETLLTQDTQFGVMTGSPSVSMFSSVTGDRLSDDSSTDSLYWKTNMVSPVRFSDALKAMVTQREGGSPDVLIEVGPSGALAGPVSQVLKSLPTGGDITYCASWARGDKAIKALFNVAGHLFMKGADINMALVNSTDIAAVRTIIDLPNYSWNHSIKYWHESAASKDWRFRQFINHDLIGSKIFGTSWHNPTWRKHLMLDDVPWLRDHKMGPDVLIPGAGLATMAVEAMFQKHSALNPEKAVTSANELAYRLRNVRFDRALVVEEGKECTILLTLTKTPGSKDWHEFRISTSKDDVSIDHCFGLIRVQDPVEEKLSGDALAPLRQPTPFTLWYKAQREAGMGFGPSFKKVVSLEATSGERSCRAMVDLTPPKSKWDPQSFYPFHPAVLDACLQVAMPANASNERSLVKDVIVPGIVNEAIINKVPYNMQQGLAIAKSGYTGRGRPDQAKSIISDISVYDPETGAMFMQVKGLNYVKLDVVLKPDTHTFDRVVWRPDVSLLTQDQLMRLTPDDFTTSMLDSVIDLVAHKKPMLSVLEVNLNSSDKSSLWFEKSDMAPRLAYSRYTYASNAADTLVSVQAAHESHRDSSFQLVDTGVEGLGLNENGAYDLAIIKAPKEEGHTLQDTVENLKPLLTSNAFTALILHGTEPYTQAQSKDASEESSDNGANSPDILGVETPFSRDSVVSEATSVSSVPDYFAVKKSLGIVGNAAPGLLGLLGSNIFESTLEVVELIETGENGTKYLCKNSEPINSDAPGVVVSNDLIVARFNHTPRPLGTEFLAPFEKSGWNITERSISAAPDSTPAGAVTLVLDELSGPMMTEANESQWEALRSFTASGNPLLWVTKGSQHQVSTPDNALVHGLFRVVRHEDPSAKLVTLDVEASSGPTTTWAINQVLNQIRAGKAEEEYAERDGVLHVPRVVPDNQINAFKRAEVEGTEPVIKSLHGTETMVQIRAEKVGSLELMWCENHVDVVPVEPGFIEVEVMAIGVNFKVGFCLRLCLAIVQSD